VSIGPDDFHKPLGQPADQSGSALARRAKPLVLAAILGAGFSVLSYLASDSRHVGEPFATATIAPVAPDAPTPARKGGAETAEPTLPATATAAEIEGASGVTVVRPGGSSAPGSVVISVPDSISSVKLAAAPDARLVERSELGPLPRIGADGARPAQVYARPAPASAKGRPRIALVLGGVGLNDSTTTNAISRLPGEISLAFAPYGQALKGQIAKAREAGHEVLLQVPMEPFDYPQTNPGPQTLTLEAGATQNLERLHWVMTRAPGYVGIENFLGARFTADEGAITPVLKDLAERGLIFVDDGSSARSIAPAIAASLNLSVRRADIVIDAAPNAAAIDAALAQLESLARDKGLAAASANALPVTIDRLAHWAAGLAERGIDLVPVSATVNLKAKG
jgi:polysaccharide deacetylase 2 family uncharacterized protein YibQ